MAILSKIRQRSFLAIGLIGFALLAFVVSDLVQKGQFNSASKDVGTINGKDIPFDQFRLKVANTEKSGEGITSIQAANKVWEQEVNMALINSEYEKIGIRVGENHLIENLKNDPNIGQNPSFLNALGKFDIKKFKDYFKSNPEQAKMFADREKDAEFNSKAVIYSTLVKSGMYTTNAEGKFSYELANSKVNFDYVAVLYSTIKDSEVKVTDADITDYIKKNEKRFKSEETRELEYVLVEDKPSKQDETEISTKITTLLNGGLEFRNGKNDTIPSFRNTTNNVEFVGENSDVPFDTTYVTKQDLPAEHAEKLFNLATGEVYGPYTNGKYSCITKNIGRKIGAKAKLSQIVIGWAGSQTPNQKEKRTKAQALAKAQELLTQAQANPTGFMMMAFSSSDDQSAQRGGDIGFFEKG
ncbi:MAG: SurA N-terminal domain-containing protein, partial [Flavobacterium sp.]|nr:SurA N-terminal domain-containing protein [Flavobacterium sp.]